MDIERSFQNAVDTFFEFLPNVLGFLLVLVIGFIVAKLVAKLVAALLAKAGVDQHLRSSSVGSHVERAVPNGISGLIAKLVFWLIFIFFLVAAIGVLQIAAVTTFMNELLAYLPNVLVAILIFIVAALLSGAVVKGITRVMGDTPTGRIVSTIVPALIMVIAMFMILEQLQIAPEIVRIAFAATMGALALGLALAFGLGGRGVAERMLEDAYRKGVDARDQMRSDMSSASGSTSAGTTAGTGGYTAGTTGSTGAATGPLADSPPQPGTTYDDPGPGDSTRRF